MFFYYSVSKTPPTLRNYLYKGLCILLMLFYAKKLIQNIFFCSIRNMKKSVELKNGRCLQGSVRTISPMAQGSIQTAQSPSSSLSPQSINSYLKLTKRRQSLCFFLLYETIRVYVQVCCKTCCNGLFEKLRKKLLTFSFNL